MKYTLLALLAQAPAHGYELKQAYEDIFGAVKAPLNAGQIYTTLSRLERDGLVENFQVEQDDRPNKKVYSLTTEGHSVLTEWLETPESVPTLHNEFYSKLILAYTTGIADVQQLIAQQRRVYLQSLKTLNDMTIACRDDMTSRLLIEGAIYHLQADLKWLDLCEAQFNEQ